MLTNKEVIFRIKNTLKEQNKDSVLSNKHIYNVLKTAAALLISRESNKSKFYLHSEMWQTYCVDMIQVSIVECSDIPFDCKIWRSKEKLPKFLSTDTGFLYKSVTSLDNTTNFYYGTVSTILHKSKLKYNKNKYFWIENNYLYSLHAFPKLKIIAFFEDDLENKCSKLDSNFKAPLFLIDSIIKTALQELTVFKQLPNDVIQQKDSNS